MKVIWDGGFGIHLDCAAVWQILLIKDFAYATIKQYTFGKN